jgi:UDP-N-acetylglucosamine:LPS N-acetylglucosamine transferase
MCYGKPMILVPTPSHTEQLSNAKQAENLGVAKTIQQKGLSKEKLLEHIRQILKDNTLERLEKVQKEVLKYDGVENAVNAVIEMTKNKQVF